MFWSLAPLVVACVVLAGLVGTCSLQPKGPAVGTVPTYDAAAALRSDGAALNFPIRLPAVPTGWHANSGGHGTIGEGRTDPKTHDRRRASFTRVGYLAPSKMFVSLTQSDADETALVESIHTGIYPAGTQDVGGVKWIVYQGGEGDEPVWTTRLDSSAGPAQLAITGAANSDDFRTLAASTQTQPPLPRN